MQQLLEMSGRLPLSLMHLAMMQLQSHAGTLLSASAALLAGVPAWDNLLGTCTVTARRGRTGVGCVAKEVLPLRVAVQGKRGACEVHSIAVPPLHQHPVSGGLPIG